MKRFFWLGCIVLMGTFLTPCSSLAFHSNNYSGTWSCGLCHPGGPHAWIPECIECHNNDTGAPYTDTEAPKMTTHSSAAMGELANVEYGEWSRKCVDCHEPHHNNGITMRGGVSDPSYIVAEFTADYAVTVDYVTTMNITSPITINDSTWADPATWGAKRGPERGLVLLVVIRDKTYWYEVLNADANSITFSNGATFFPQYPKSNPIFMKLVYGMFIQNEVNGTSVTFPAFPECNTWTYDESGTGLDPTPDGICQVCHVNTSVWNLSGSGANHFNGWDCIVCHRHENGFKFVTPENHHLCPLN